MWCITHTLSLSHCKTSVRIITGSRTVQVMARWGPGESGRWCERCRCLPGRTSTVDKVPHAVSGHTWSTPSHLVHTVTCSVGSHLVHTVTCSVGSHLVHTVTCSVGSHLVHTVTCSVGSHLVHTVTCNSVLDKCMSHNSKHDLCMSSIDRDTLQHLFVGDMLRKTRLTRIVNKVKVSVLRMVLAHTCHHNKVHIYT